MKSSSRTPQIEVVGIARDAGLDALEKAASSSRLDVVTLDLVMPGLDGLGFLRAMPRPGPRVVVVTISSKETELAVAALQAGAFDVVHKPTALATEQLYEMATPLVAAVLAAGRSRARRSRRRGARDAGAAGRRAARGRRPARPRHRRLDRRPPRP